MRPRPSPSCCTYFYPRPPRGGRPRLLISALQIAPISIHALREEGDCCRWHGRTFHSDFYPRPPRGGRPPTLPCRMVGRIFLSTPSARRATTDDLSREVFVDISIHALREEGDARLNAWACSSSLFLSTPSARRATTTLWTGWTSSKNFYPRPPRGGRPPVLPWHGQGAGISIHALREEGDSSSPMRRPVQNNFYPRPPRGGRPGRFASLLHLLAISIHALREEGDSRRPKTASTS